jgi:hypothetical protein
MGEEAALDPARVATHRVEVSKRPLLVLLGGLGRPDLHAALDALHQDDSLRERGAVSGRDRDPVLRVERVLGAAAKGHRSRELSVEVESVGMLVAG